MDFTDVGPCDNSEMSETVRVMPAAREKDSQLYIKQSFDLICFFFPSEYILSWKRDD